MLEFYTFIPDLVSSMPIEKSNISDFVWYNKMVADLKQCRRVSAHTSRCPGIIGIGNMGWIQRSYQDFVIHTNGDGVSFDFECEIDQKKLMYGDLMNDYISLHPASQLFDFGNFKKNTLKTIVKIQSPWVVKIPKGYSVIAMPIPLSDRNEFTSACGILKHTNFLNVQLFWHSLNDSVVIKKGTPLQQYIMVMDESLPYSVNQIESSLVDNIIDDIRAQK